MDARESRGVVATPWGRDRVALCAGGRRTCAANHAGRLLIRGTGGRPRPRTSVSHDENVKTAGKSRDSAVVGFHLKCTALRTPSADEHRAAFLHTLVLGLGAGALTCPDPPARLPSCRPDVLRLPHRGRRQLGHPLPSSDSAWLSPHGCCRAGALQREESAQ